jgi:GNAT superfamily N-acetyltransferase
MIDTSKIITAVAGESDVAELVQLINSAYRGDSSKAGWTTEADILDGTRIDEAGVLEIMHSPKEDLHIFRLEGEGLIACVYLKKGAGHLYLGMLTVRPTLQAGGMGKFILHYAENLAEREGLPKVRMTVINKRLELIAWYNRHGYLPTGETEAWVDGQHIGHRKTDLHFIVLEKLLSK